MDKLRYVLDTNTIIWLLKSETIPEIFDSVELFASIISRIELLSKPDITPEDEREIQNFLSAITVVGIDSSIESKAIDLRRSRKLKLPDSIIAATAIVLNATLLTRDDQLLHLSWPSYQAQGIAPTFSPAPDNRSQRIQNGTPGA